MGPHHLAISPWGSNSPNEVLRLRPGSSRVSAGIAPAGTVAHLGAVGTLHPSAPSHLLRTVVQKKLISHTFFASTMFQALRQRNTIPSFLFLFLYYSLG